MVFCQLRSPWLSLRRGSVLSAIGLIVGLLANPGTAWFAIFELGIPAAIAGGILGLASGAMASVARRGS